MNAPSKAEVASVMRSLLARELTREQAAAWATGYLAGDVQVTDTRVWSALELLGAADLCSCDRPFLYEDEDYQDCLAQLEGQGD